MQVNARQMEARVLLRRTCDRTANLNKYFLKYWRANHDVSPLIDSSHSMRYATKYAAKNSKHSELLMEVIEHPNKRSADLLPPNMKQVLSDLMSADCSHRAFVTKHELAYRVMNLPMVCKSFTDVSIVGFYKRGNIKLTNERENIIEYSDRTEYTAYSERLKETTELTSRLTREELDDMSLNDFASTINRTWVKHVNTEQSELPCGTKRKFRARDINSGHWIFS